MGTQDILKNDLQRLTDDVTERLNNTYYRMDKKKKIAADYKQIMTDFCEGLEQGKKAEDLLKGMRLIS